MTFEFLEHTADIKLKVEAKTLDALFEEIVKALAAHLNHQEPIKTTKGKTISVSGSDYPSLLYNFIDELIYLIDAENFIPAKASVQMRGFNLTAELTGDTASNYPLDQLKAATYAEMDIKKTPKGWTALFVIDV
ncbi:MAG TPA: archease [Candidatus Nanoarchaeia archaeon]|nr:archease [Candidatus Nanoarchaeia archaeon]